MKTIRIACVGGWHSHAKDFPMDRAKKFCSHIPYSIDAVWDDKEDRGREWAAEMGCRFEPDYDALCADPNIDAFIITAGTTRHGKLLKKAAAAHKHVFMEKALTTDPMEAAELRDIVNRSGIHFTISDPVEKPELIYAKRLADAGVFGKITSIRYKTSHAFGITDPALMSRYYTRKETGGGCMFDMGHHAVHVLYWFLGSPTGVTGIFSRFSELGKENNVDDIAAALFSFESGAIGIAETGYLCPGGGSIFELYGTKGQLRWDRGSDGLRYRFDEKQPWIVVPPEELPEGAKYPLLYWMESIINDTYGDQYTIDQAAAVAQMIAAAYTTDGWQATINYR
ncbi:MAG: Gfo/Idh/MocA family protein [Faecousia sp.]